MPRKKIIEQKETGHRFYKTYLNKGIEMLDTMSRRHRRVMQTRMDFRYPESREVDGTNKEFSDKIGRASCRERVLIPV